MKWQAGETYRIPCPVCKGETLAQYTVYAHPSPELNNDILLIELTDLEAEMTKDNDPIPFVHLGLCPLGHRSVLYTHSDDYYKRFGLPV